MVGRWFHQRDLNDPSGTLFWDNPLMYQKLSKKMSDDESTEVLKAIDQIIKVPAMIGFLPLWLGGTVIVAIAIVTGVLAVPMCC